MGNYTKSVNDDIGLEQIHVRSIPNLGPPRSSVTFADRGFLSIPDRGPRVCGRPRTADRGFLNIPDRGPHSTTDSAAFVKIADTSHSQLQPHRYSAAQLASQDFSENWDKHAPLAPAFRRLKDITGQRFQHLGLRPGSYIATVYELQDIQMDRRSYS